MVSLESDGILRELADARTDYRNRFAAAESFRKALRLKADIAAADGFPEAGLPSGVLRARRRELELSVQYLVRMESAVKAAAERLAEAERIGNQELL